MLPTRFAAPVLALLFAAPAPAMAATVTLISQDRSIAISIPSNDGGAGVGNDPPVSERREAVGFEDFDDRLANSVSGAFGQFSEASTGQDSSVREVEEAGVRSVVEFRSSGTSSYSSFDTDQLTFASSNAEFTFAVDEAVFFTLTGGGSYTDTFGGASGFNVALLAGDGSVLQRFGGSGSDGPDFDGDLEFVDFAETGSLFPGTYTLRAGDSVSGGIGSTSSSHSVLLELAPATLVPSPAALPAGLALGAATLLRRRREG